MRRAMFAICLAVALVAAAPVIPLAAQQVNPPQFTTVVNFHGGDGWGPDAALIQGLDGSLYGTTERGGDLVDCQQGCGTVFKLNLPPRVGTLELLPSDGESPLDSLVLTNNGDFYGTTISGGIYGDGTIFEVSDGRMRALYSFCAQPNCTDGKFTQAALVQASDGNFYGTTPYGGANTKGCAAHSYGCGTVFKVTTAGTFTTLYNFCALSNCIDGISPIGGLIQADDGNLYGSTSAGGAHQGGTIFRITPAGKLTTLYSFCARAQCADGSYPVGSLLQATDGNLYGATFTGGGTLFRITKAGVLTTLHTFCTLPSCTDGESPQGGLIQGNDGNFYGITTEGGSYGSGPNGTVFQMTPAGTLTTLHSFNDTGSSPSLPFGGLLQATDGTFYGTTGGGGDPFCNAGYGCGTIFRFEMGLPPFVTFVQRLGRIGRPVVILGQGFTGTTSVSFGGISAEFTVQADTYLIAKVPAGASTGYVTVSTPNGALTSNVPFQVSP